MNTTHHYVVLRLAPNDLRGEVINVGIVLLSPDQAPQTIVMATLNKLRALDSSWSTQKLNAWRENINAILANYSTPSAQVQALGRFGICDADAVGVFTAATAEETARELGRIKAVYIANRQREDAPKREKRTRLQTVLREQFKKMQVLGETMDDIAAHLVVPNVPVIGYPELKADFVYKNGTYRVTQTIDYNVSRDSLHSKLAEACVKSTAAELAFKAYGPATKRLAVLDIPEAYADVTDAHIDLLIAQGFEVFHFTDEKSMAEYMTKAVPQLGLH